MPLLERFTRTAWIPRSLRELLRKGSALGEQSHPHREGLAIHQAIE